MSDEKKKLVEIKHLKKYFSVNDASSKGLRRKKNTLKAVDDVSFDIYEGETFGLVGESGCGKTTLGRAVIRLYNPTDGEVFFEGEDISRLNQKELTKHRRKMHMIFQDPYASLDPRMTVSEIIMEAMPNDDSLSVEDRRKRVLELLELVGLNSDHASRYPHEFSGGQRQRVGVARSLAANPKFIVCDEPISALDVSIQAQVVNLLKDLQHKLGLTYLFIAHDLSMVQYISDRVGVMYLGKMVELADSEVLYSNPMHPYTQALMSAIPVPDPDMERNKRRIIVEGEVPSPINPPSGCAFHTRCPKATERCSQAVPEFREINSGHFVACHLFNSNY